MVSNIKAFAKFIDQPMLISKFNRGMPRTLLASGAMFWGVDTYDTMTKSDNKIRATKDSIKKAIVIASTVASAIVAPKIASKVAKRPLMPSVSEIRASNRALIDTFLKRCNTLTFAIQYSMDLTFQYKFHGLTMKSFW